LSSIASLFIERLFEFLERDFSEEEVRIEVVGRSFKAFSHEGFVELVKGSEYVLPRWVSNMLVEEGVVKIREEGIDVEKLSSIAYNEEASLKKLNLMKLPRYFYLMVRHRVDDIRSRLTSSADISLLEEFKQLEDLLYTIGRIRVKKLFNYILLPSVPQDVLDKLSEEEKMLYTLYRNFLETWMKKLGLEKQ